MLKTITILAALATLATGTIAPAHALVSLNGNGTNGVGNNGIYPNGTGNNGIVKNGQLPNGQLPNGQVPNGQVPNGAANGTSVLTIQALELPPQAR